MKKGIDIFVRYIILVLAVFITAGMPVSCSDKYDVIEDEEPADEYILLFFNSYRHKNYYELIKDVEFAFTNSIYRQ